MKEGKFFCVRCGVQLASIDEIEMGVCARCEGSMYEITKHGDFYCWACGTKLLGMAEIAQGVCGPCKSKIIKTLHSSKKEVKLENL